MTSDEILQAAKEVGYDWVFPSLPLEKLERFATMIEKRAIERRVVALMEQRDELLAATEAIAINSEECLDFDECTAMLVSIDDYHKLMEAAARAKGEQ